MSSSRYCYIAACLGLLAGSLHGCGGGDTTQAPAPSPPVITPTPAPPKGPALTFPTEFHASAGRHNLTLGAVDFLDWGFQTRGYGSIPGPTFRMKPGETLQIRLINNLNPDHNRYCNETGTNFCDSEVSNIHTHGLHVSSEPGSDDIFTEVHPGTSQDFDFTIPDFHAPGIHWYHPHHHHATAIQAGGGAAGVIIVDDPEDYLPEVFKEMEEVVLMVNYLNLQDLQKYARESMSTLLANAYDKAVENGHPADVYLVNGQYRPEFTMKSGRWYRFRVVFAAIKLEWEMELQNMTGESNCQLRDLAKDGIYLKKIPRVTDHLHLFPGAREDVAISCTCKEYPCRLHTSPQERPEMQILTLTVEEGTGVAPDLPDESFEPPRPCYLADMRGAKVEHSGRLTMHSTTIAWDGVGDRMSWENVQAVGGMEQWPGMGKLAVAGVYEMRVSGVHSHPLHTHVNPYQIVELMPGRKNNGLVVGDFHDSILNPYYLRDDIITVRMNTNYFTGKLVVHCHRLEHEDRGMMNFFDVNGTEGTMWECGKSLNTRCYDTAFNATAFNSNETPDHPIDSSCLSPAPGTTSGTASESSVERPSRIGWLVAGATSAGLSLGGLAFVCFVKASSQKRACEEAEACDEEGQDVELKDAGA